MVLLVMVAVFLSRGGKPVGEKGQQASNSQKTNGKGDKASSATKPPATEQAKDEERSVAEWVLENGGQVALLNQGSLFEKVADLPAAPFTVVHVVVRNVAEFTEADSQRLTKLRELDAVEFRFTILAPGAIRTLANCQNLTEMRVIDGSTTEATLSEVSLVPQLRTLAFGNVAVTDDVLPRLGELRQLTYLQVYDCRQVTEEGFVRLAAAPPPKLQTMHLGVTKIGAAGMRAISTLPHLNDLILAHTQLSDAGLLELTRCPSLASVDLGSHPDVTQAAITKLQQSLANCQVRVTTPDQAAPLYGPPIAIRSAN